VQHSSEPEVVGNAGSPQLHGLIVGEVEAGG
jgi:hypothetical protein